MTRDPSSETTLPGERWHDLDAVRAFALLLGVALHGVMSFMEPRVWIIADRMTSSGADVLFYVIHIFRMTTFFVLAGFFARMLMQKKGVGGFITNRLTRIGIPLVAFWPLTMAAIIVMLIIGNMPAPGAPAAPTPPPPAMTVATFPLTHMWFLYALLLFYAGAAIIKIITDVLHVGGFLGKVLDGVVRVLTRYDLITLLLAVPVAATFYFNNTWLMWFGITTPDTGLIPNLMAIAGFTTSFVFGWWLNRSPDLLDHLAKRWWAYAFAAIGGTWWCLSVVGKTTVMVPVAGHDHALYAYLYPLTAWSWAFFLIGFARAFIKTENPLIRRISDASYWIYIVHVPLVLVFQYLVEPLDLAVPYKFGVVLFGTFAVGMLSYQLLVRYSFIGTILNGRKRKDKRAALKEAAA
jgi:glucan biosynthesis protein C